MFGNILCTRNIIARTCKVFRFARKLSTAPADLESRVRVRVRVWVRVRVGSGVGLVWAAQPLFGADLHIGSRHTIAIEFRANLKNLARTCTFTGAPDCETE